MIDLSSYTIKLLIALLLLSSMLMMSSCKDDITFASEHKTTIDTMFLNRKKPMRDEIDSLCFISNEQLLQSMMDSIMDVRILDIKSRLQSLQTQSATQ